MSSHHLRLIATLAVALAAALAASPAGASPPPKLKCGTTLTRSVTLTRDLVCPDGDGLVIGADGITVDLDGHTIDGVAAAVDCKSGPNPRRAGVRNAGGYDRITVENGSVRGFHTGVAAGSDDFGMSDSRIHDLVLRDNRFGGIHIGSGAGAAATARNVVDHNAVSGSPCDSGIEVNTGQANRFAHNRVDGAGAGIVICCGEASDGNVAEGNRVDHTTDPGVLVFASGASRVVGNVVTDVADADGITIASSSDALVSGNRVARVQFAGIAVVHCWECEGAHIPTGVRVGGNALDATSEGIVLADTDGDVVRANMVTRAGSYGAADTSGAGVLLDGVSGTVVRANLIADGGRERGAGILVGIPGSDHSARPVSGNVFAGNVVTGQRADGILVVPYAQDTTLWGNRADRNAADGIHVLSPASRLRGNSANRNGAVGIEADPGVTDAGGNEAHGNASAQCTGVVCS